MILLERGEADTRNGSEIGNVKTLSSLRLIFGRSWNPPIAEIGSSVMSQPHEGCANISSPFPWTAIDSFGPSVVTMDGNDRFSNEGYYPSGQTQSRIPFRRTYRKSGSDLLNLLFSRSPRLCASDSLTFRRA